MKKIIDRINFFK